MRRSLVTGGAGFLGSHLVEQLITRGNEVICIDNFLTGRWRNVAAFRAHPRFEVIRHDVTQPLGVEVDEIYHLACPASPVHYQRSPVRTIQTAVQGTLRMLELAREVGARFLITSTSEIYGEPAMHPQEENYWGNVNPVGTRSCYDEGKRCAEALTSAFVKQFGVQARIVRIFNTYGPRMDEHDGRVVSNFITQALRHEPLSLFGCGEQTRSFCYVSDMTEALIRVMALEHDPGPINLGNPDERTVRELAELVIELTGSSSQLVRTDLPEDDPSRRCPSIEKARTLLNWQPRIPLREGLEATIADFRARYRELERARVAPEPLAQRATNGGRAHQSFTPL